MVVVLDSLMGDRTRTLREIILLGGYPCAAADIGLIILKEALNKSSFAKITLNQRFLNNR